jgi:putative ABC transport system permease protein
MFKNYFTVALRNFRRNKVFSFINIIGLAIGISASLVIYLIASYDFGFDKFENNNDRIYRVVSNMKLPDNDFKTSGVPLPLIPAAQKEITGVELFAPFSTTRDINISINLPGVSKPHFYKNQKNIIYADNNYFKLLPYKWLAGSKQNALSNANTTVLTESRAKIYFPYKDVSKVIGKVITYNDTVKTTVTGVVKDLKQTTDFTFKEFISYKTLPQAQFTDAHNWGSVSFSDQFFVKLNAGTTPVTVQKQAKQLFDKNQKDTYLKAIFYLQPLSDVHFDGDYNSFAQRQAHLPTLYGLLAVAAILLLLGCINFINLTTAQAVQRAKEIGIRKTLGSTKLQLIFQFLSETFLLTLVATILSIILVPFIIKLFADFIPPEINAAMLLQTDVVIFIVLLLLAVSLLSGFYPAIILSKYNPVHVLKNKAAGSSSTRRVWIRKSLTVTQFVFAQAFIIATIIVSQQIHYALTKDLGFKKDGIITVETPLNYAELDNKAAVAKSMQTREVLLHNLQALPDIDKVCFASSAPASSGRGLQTLKFNNGKKEIETTVEIKYADECYFNLYNMKLVTGRFPKKSDSLTEYVINESYARYLGFSNPSDVVGKLIEHDNGGIPIVGVLKDFNSRPLNDPIKPLVFYSLYPVQSTLHIALQPETSTAEWKTTIAQIEKAYKTIYPGEDFSYSFFDESIAKFYESEQHTSTLLSWATGLAIIISCLGLLGLVIYTTNQRTKEIGVRKVLGASILQIVHLLTKDFLKLITLAFVIAAPIVWWGMNKWFENFAYHTQISVWIFAGAGLLMILIASITLGFQTIKAANANPVKSLRTE